MKKNLLLVLLFLAFNSFAQEKTDVANEDYGILISGGYHVGFWALLFNRELKANQLPYNIHIDKTLGKKHFVGIGYSHDHFGGNPHYGSWYNSPSLRQNLRVRFCWFLSDSQKKFSTYLGMSAGISRWTSLEQDTEGNTDLAPTAQFLFGMKVKLTELFFWQTEFGAGPPYALQTSLGIKF